MSREQEREFSALWEKASAAGMVAGSAMVPRPMVVMEDGGFGRENEIRQAWIVNEGACGFAWVVVRPGNAPFANWAKKNRGARAEYGGGCCVKWVSEFNQSAERKERYAQAFARVLAEAGINASARSRLD